MTRPARCRAERKYTNLCPLTVLAIMGLPGSGKSTQAAQLHKNCNAVVLSGGDELRSRAANGDALAASLLAAGLPIPADLYAVIVANWLDQQQQQGTALCVLDGSPRHPDQVYALRSVIDRRTHTRLSGVLLTVSVFTARERLIARHSESKTRRADDDPTIMERRLNVQDALLAKTTAAFAGLWPLAAIDGSVVDIGAWVEAELKRPR